MKDNRKNEELRENEVKIKEVTNENS